MSIAKRDQERRGVHRLAWSRSEDAPVTVRARLAGMAAQRGVSLDHLPIHLVMHRSLRLESRRDQARLAATVERYRPKLLVLDPFVRLSAIDENSSLEVSGVLAALRQMQTTLSVAILVVHHARKSGANGTAGLALRGSGDFWAWGDSNLYLSRRQERLQLSIEHRSAPAPQPVVIELRTDHEAGPYIRCCDGPCDDEQPRPLSERILDALRSSSAPHRLDDLRTAMRVRMQSLVDALRQLEQDRPPQPRLEAADVGFDGAIVTGVRAGERKCSIPASSSSSAITLAVSASRCGQQRIYSLGPAIRASRAGEDLTLTVRTRDGGQVSIQMPHGLRLRRRRG